MAMRWPSGGRPRRVLSIRQGRCQRQQRVEIDVLAHSPVRSFHEGIDALDFAGQHQTEMAFGHCQIVIAGHRPRGRGCRALQRLAQHLVMARQTPTRLKITPADLHVGRQCAKPATSGATDCACRAASTTSTTGSSSIAARSPVEPSRPPRHRRGPSRLRPPAGRRRRHGRALALKRRLWLIAQGSRLTHGARRRGREIADRYSRARSWPARAPAPRAQRRQQAERDHGLAGPRAAARR